MGLRRIIRLFKDGNVCVTGLRGRGKDMLMANVVVRRRKPYVSNTDYGGECYPFNPLDYDCGCNTYENFIQHNVYKYVYPHKDGTDIYIGDCGIYFPAQYCNQLNRDYGYIATFMALSRHLGDCNVHFNVQNLNRVWDKIREQSDNYIACNRCKVLFGKIVLQTVTIYELYESAVRRVPPFRVPRPWFNRNRIQTWQLAKQSYDISNGKIDRRFLLYWNRSKYNTRIFKEVLENGKDKESK